jgi:chlorite dismutase
MSMSEIPPVPLTLDGSAVLHQMFRIRRSAWRTLDWGHKGRILENAVPVFTRLEQGSQDGHPNQSAFFSQVGHKGDLMVVHFRDTIEEVHRAELEIARLEISDYLEPTHSYLSTVELGLYESSSKTYGALAEKGIAPHTPEWNAGTADVIARQAGAMTPRLFPRIPSSKYLCFYPMDRKRGEAKNWYEVPMAERQRMMHEHGMIGRRYADCVQQIISGSIGFDDWEWGVDLFADDAKVFKKLIYEMRFDEVSAVYALFGNFYIGLRVPPSAIDGVFGGELP